MKKLHIVLLLFSGMSCLTVYAQDVHVEVGKESILIGEPLELNIKVHVPSSGYTMQMQLEDSIPHFELLDKGVVKASNDSVHFLEQTIRLTSFDSGLWSLRPIQISLIKEQEVVTTNTPFVQIHVTYADDEPEELHDIRSVIHPESSINYWYLSLITILLLCIGYLLWRRLRNRSAVPVIVTQPGSAYETAMRLLSETNPNEHDAKFFYSKLTDILKSYITNAFGVKGLPKTTDEILIWFSRLNDDTIKQQAAGVLRMADAAKFAKYNPDEETRKNALTTIKQLIEILHQLPEK